MKNLTADNKNFSLNFSETEKFIDYLLTNKTLLPQALQPALSALITQLQKLLAKQDSLEEDTLSLKRLCLKLLERDPVLQDRVAQDLSSSQRLICTKDAQLELANKFRNLCKGMQENTQAFAALLRFLCNILVSLTNKKLLGAGLEHDLLGADIAVPNSNLSIRHQIYTERMLQAVLAYISLSQRDYLLKASASNKETIKTSKRRLNSQRTTAQIMTHYLKRALEEFPQGSSYLDSFKHGQSAEAQKYQDDLSEQTAKRIHDIIAKAADIAKSGSLMGKAQNEPKAFEALASKRHHLTQALNDNKENLNSDPSQLSLKELAARAARLQEQFRKERQRLAAEGKLPDPAQLPKPEEPLAKAAAQEQKSEQTDLIRESQSTGDPQKDQILRSLSSLASRSQIVAASIKGQKNAAKQNKSN